MSLPCRLYPGIISVYGAGSVNGLITEKMQFGLVDQMYDDSPNTISIGDSVMFKLDKAEIVTYGNIVYFLINQSDIKLIETIAT